MLTGTKTKTKIKSKLTYNDYLKIVDSKRYELIEGELIEMASPNVKHQRILSEINDIFKNFVKKHKLGEVFFSPLDIVFADDTVLQPDLVFVSKENSAIIKDKIFGSPDLVLEILSPSSMTMDKYTKYNLYEKHKVNEYWIIDPANQIIEILTLNKNGKYELLQEIEEKTARSKVLKGLEIRIDNIFS